MASSLSTDAVDTCSADADMRVHMLERELARAQKDIVALRCQLRCQPGAAQHPAVLRTAAVSLHPTP